VRNHVKLEICHELQQRGVFFQGTILCGGYWLLFPIKRTASLIGNIEYGLGRYLGDCKPALPEEGKYQMVKTQTKP
jgi:hypothetical protein